MSFVDGLVDGFSNIFRAINNFWVGISSWFSNFYSIISNFFDSVINVLGYIWSIFKGLWYGLTTLLSGVGESLKNVLGSGIFGYLYNGFTDLVNVVGYGPAIFIASLLFVAMVRICIGFVFKMFRLNTDYKTMVSKWK